MIFRMSHQKYYSVINKKEAEKPLFMIPLVSTCDPFGARTQDPNIKSVVLYQLS